MNVLAIPSDLNGTTRYSSQTRHITHDVAYDMWLSQSATTTPCETDGTVEVMVWTDYNIRAPVPDSLKVGTTDVPFAVNGIANRDSNAWSVFVSNIDRGGHTAPWVARSGSF
jgi:hypothetical protein